IAFSLKADETASETQYIAAVPHYLESWGDVEIKKGHYALTQPTIRPLFNTRQFQEALLKWNGNDMSYHDYIKDAWGTTVLGGSSFNQALHDGIFVGNIATESKDTVSEQKNDKTFVGGIIEDVAEDLGLKKKEATPAPVIEDNSIFQTDAANALANSGKGEGFELTLYTKVGMGDGQQANNPWLQEFPDPITRASWDNYLTISRADADTLGLKNFHVATGGLNGSYAKITFNETSVIAPVMIQPGQAKGSVGLALGYGKTKGLKEEMQTGVNAYALYHNFNNVQNVTIEKASGEHEFASVQLHNTLM